MAAATTAHRTATRLTMLEGEEVSTRRGRRRRRRSRGGYGSGEKRIEVDCFLNLFAETCLVMVKML